MISKPFQVLGIWTPDLDQVKFGCPFGICYAWQYRSPVRNITVAQTDPSVCRFHHDCDNEDSVRDECRYIAAWSNRYSTEVLLPDGEIVAGKDNEVVLFDNRVCQHRVPNEYARLANLVDRPMPRHFMRLHIGDWLTDDLADGYRRQLQS
jgi:hypothetical protein